MEHSHILDILNKDSSLLVELIDTKEMSDYFSIFLLDFPQEKIKKAFTGEPVYPGQEKEYEKTKSIILRGDSLLAKCSDMIFFIGEIQEDTPAEYLALRYTACAMFSEESFFVGKNQEFLLSMTGYQPRFEERTLLDQILADREKFMEVKKEYS